MGPCTSKIDEKVRNLIFQDTHLPEPDIFSNFQIMKMLTGTYFPIEKQIIVWQAQSNAIFSEIIGTPKSDKTVLKKIQEAFKDKIIPYKDVLPPDYKYFGTDNSVENLELFVRNNPFFASALISSKDNSPTAYSILSKSDSKKTDTWFSRLISTLDNIYLRVNVTFDKNFKVLSTTCFKEEEKVKKSKEEACAALLLLFIFYNECFHATIHIFHFMMISALADSTADKPIMDAWAQPYFPNVHLKFEEVKILLFGEDSVLTGGTFKANRSSVLEICREMMCVWGNSKSLSDFHKNFLFAKIQSKVEELQETGLLSEYLKHATLSQQYSHEIYEEFGKINNGKDLQQVDQNLKLFLENCGPGVSSVDNLKTWIQLMSATGIIHGGTLGFTRLIMTQPVLSLLTPGDQYTYVDYVFVAGAASTIVGTLIENTVMSDQIQDKKSMSPTLRNIIIKYAGLSCDLKIKYYQELSKDPDFTTKGWILSDYCSEGIDGKQLTLTTYI